MHKPKKGEPGLLILERRFRFHLLTVRSNLKRQVAMHCTPKIASESLNREVSCWAGSAGRCGFVCGERVRTMWKTFLLKPWNRPGDPKHISKRFSSSTSPFFKWK